MRSRISVIIPAYNEEKRIPDLIESFKIQTVSPLETILVNDSSTDSTAKLASDFFKVISTPRRGGPAAARNIGMKIAKGDVFAFMDADCHPETDWVEQIEKQFRDKNVSVIVGGARVVSSTLLGQAIAALGFPAGGAIGFEKMWRVAPDGTVRTVSSANFAIRKWVIEKIGGFDETFSYYCEDAWFAHCLVKAGVPITYIPDIEVQHAPMESLHRFFVWHYNRGRGNYVFKRKVGKVMGFVKLRIWSSMNIIKNYYKDAKFPLILFLLGSSFFLQQLGFFVEKFRSK